MKFKNKFSKKELKLKHIVEYLTLKMIKPLKLLFKIVKNNY